MRLGLKFIYLPMEVHLLQHHLLKSMSFLQWIAFAPLSKITWAYLCRSISGSSVPFVSVPSPVPHTFNDQRYNMSWSWVEWFFFKIVLALLVPLPFHINFRIILPISTKSLAGIFIGIMLNIYQFGENWHFSVLSLPIHEYGMSLCIFRFCLIFWISVLWLSAYKSYTCFVRFTPKYFIFQVIINGIIFLISASTCSLLVHRNTVDFCMFIFCPVILLNSLTSSISL